MQKATSSRGTFAMDASPVKAFVSRKTVLSNGVTRAIVTVREGKIENIYYDLKDEDSLQAQLKKLGNVEIEDFGSLVLMAGVMDSHVHVNDPGRKTWEDFSCATKAAAAGGVTTIFDMPLNSIPPATTVENLKKKVKVARTKSYVDVGFWGGVIPGNQDDLKPLINAGVVGFKCFLCPSGVAEFPQVSQQDVKVALTALKGTDSLLAFHAELEDKDASKVTGDPEEYKTFLKTHPPSMEINAVSLVRDLCKKYNYRCHIVHVSANEVLPIIADAKKNKIPLTAETCYHYLHLTAEQIPRCATQFKCTPPIRSRENREKLWEGVKSGVLDMIVSDHSPCVEDLKEKDFLISWGGISSLQFGLPITWTEARARNLSLIDVSKLLSSAVAKVLKLDHRKGSIKVGMDADFVVWNPDKEFEIKRDDIHYKNEISPYIGEKVFGEVFATILRGNYVFKEGTFSSVPKGEMLLNADFKID